PPHRHGARRGNHDPRSPGDRRAARARGSRARVARADHQPRQRGHALRPGAHWALLADGTVTMHRTSYDIEAACAAIGDQSDYPDVAEWTDYFLHSRASDADALGAFAPRDGRVS